MLGLGLGLGLASLGLCGTRQQGKAKVLAPSPRPGVGYPHTSIPPSLRCSITALLDHSTVQEGEMCPLGARLIAVTPVPFKESRAWTHAPTRGALVIHPLMMPIVSLALIPWNMPGKVLVVYRLIGCYHSRKEAHTIHHRPNSHTRSPPLSTGLDHHHEIKQGAKHLRHQSTVNSNT